MPHPKPHPNHPQSVVSAPRESLRVCQNTGQTLRFRQPSQQSRRGRMWKREGENDSHELHTKRSREQTSISIRWWLSPLWASCSLRRSPESLASSHATSPQVYSGAMKGSASDEMLLCTILKPLWWKLLTLWWSEPELLAQ